MQPFLELQQHHLSIIELQPHLSISVLQPHLSISVQQQHLSFVELLELLFIVQ
jgi:hypothetical protein